MIRIAVLDDNPLIAEERAAALREADLSIELARDAVVVFTDANELIKACDRAREPDFFDVILTDVYMPTPEEGGVLLKEWLEKKRHSDPEKYRRVQLRWITRHSSIGHLIPEHLSRENESWFQLTAEGADAAVYLSLAAENAIQRAYPISRAVNNAQLVSVSSGMREVMSLVDLAAESATSVLILGETGVGKEVIAHAIHSRSARSQKPFMIVHCGALSPELINSELFGHERGAFTGATTVRQGFFERANGGTLFLDEIGELPLDAQVRLLRVLQGGVFEKVGGQKPVKVDVRIVAATHRDLKSMIAERTFREDLWYRIKVIEIPVPPLRERREDIVPLARRFVDHFATEFNRGIISITSEAVRKLEEYHWPGNVRELKSLIEGAVLRLPVGRTTLNVEDLIGLPDERLPEDSESGLDSAEREVLNALETAGFNRLNNFDREAAASLLGRSRQAVHKYIEEHSRLKEIVKQKEREYQQAKANAAEAARRAKLPPRPTIRRPDTPI